MSRQMENALVARQPIFDRSQQVFGYELLFRARASDKTANIINPDAATAAVVLNSLTDIGLNDLVGEHRAFYNVTRNVLLSDDIFCLPADRVVIEVLEDVQGDAEVLRAIQNLKQNGYMTAVDDFVPDEGSREIAEIVDIVKIDLPGVSAEDLPDLIFDLKRMNVQVLAEKVETHEQFERCRNLGCDLFQGYFFCKPRILEQRESTCNVQGLTQLLIALQDTKVTVNTIEERLKTDPELCYKILRLVNSAKFCRTEKVDSIRHAIVLLGLSRIRGLASMLLLAGNNQSKPQELFSVALVRARMCEEVSRRTGRDQPDRMFVLGMMSAFDAVLDLTMSEVVQLLQLSDDMNLALTERRGDAGRILDQVLRTEQGSIETSVNDDTDNKSMSESTQWELNLDMSEVYLEALRWANESIQAIR